MSTFFKILGCGTAIYVAIALLLYIFQRSLIYHPHPTRPEPGNWNVPDMETVSLQTDDGLSLLAWWKPPDGELPVMVFLHGNAGHIGYRGTKVRPFLDQGYGVLLIAWRGYSGNPGKPSENGFYADGRAALDFLDQRGFKRIRRILYGESLGTGVAVELAASGQTHSLILEAPYTSLSRVATEKFPIFPVRWLLRDQYNSISKIRKFAGPLLIIHGELDRILPVNLAKVLFRAANEPKKGVFVMNAGHNNLYDFGGAAIVLNFLNRLYKSEP